MLTVACWCCGRPTDAEQLTVTLPVALAEKVREHATQYEVNTDAVVQEALSLLLLPPHKEDA